MNRGEILDTAASYVTKDREQQYGSPENNFSIVAKLWNVYLGEQNIIKDCLEAHDVAIMMALLKIARITSGQTKDDNYIDLAG